MPTPVKVKKWGSSLALLIPSQFAKSRRIAEGSVVDIENVRTVRPRRTRYQLSELLADFKPRHRQREWGLSDPVGREVW